MSSKYKKSSQSRRSNYYPTAWSEWTWNEQYHRHARYREVSEGEWEWEYAEPPETEKKTPYTPRHSYNPRGHSAPAQMPPVDEDALSVEPIGRNYRHDEGISDLNRRMAETSIESQSEDHQYSVGQQYSAGEQYSAGQHYPKYPAEHQYPPDQQYPAEQQYPLDQQYPAEQQYPEDNQNAEGEEYYQRYGDKWREKGSSELQDYRKRDKKKGSSSKARDMNSENPSRDSEQWQEHQDEDPGQYYRRKGSSSNQEYFEPSKTDPGNGKGSETICPECSMTFPRSADLERHHKTVHLNNGVRPYECLDLGCPANVRSWTTMRGLRLHEKNWHGPHSCSVPGCSRRDPFGFSSEADLEVHQVEHSGGSNLDQHGDERRRGEKRKGRSGKSADTIDEYHRSAAENYHQGGTQPLFQASSQQEGNFFGEQYQEQYQKPSYAPLYAPLYPPLYQTFARNISDATTKFKFTSDNELLRKQFVMHKSIEFYFGRVFKVLWSEPVGSGGTEITTEFPHGEGAFHKVRRFLIVSERNRGHSICIPILTYGNQGVLKRGVHPEDHAVVYSSRQCPPLDEREKGLMTKHPIRIEVTKDSHKLDPLSRLNYAKLYTVEHNVKVLFIGKVAKNYELDVKYGYNETHPPFSHAGPSSHKGSHENLTKSAEGNDPNYPLTEEPTQDGGGTSTYQGYQPYSSNSTHTVDTNYTTPAYTNPTYTTSSAYPPGPSYTAYDDGYTCD